MVNVFYKIANIETKYSAFLYNPTTGLDFLFRIAYSSIPIQQISYIKGFYKSNVYDTCAYL